MGLTDSYGPTPSMLGQGPPSNTNIPAPQTAAPRIAPGPPTGVSAATIEDSISRLSMDLSESVHLLAQDRAAFSQARENLQRSEMRFQQVTVDMGSLIANMRDQQV